MRRQAPGTVIASSDEVLTTGDVTLNNNDVNIDASGGGIDFRTTP